MDPKASVLSTTPQCPTQWSPIQALTGQWALVDDADATTTKSGKNLICEHRHIVVNSVGVGDCPNTGRQDATNTVVRPKDDRQSSIVNRVPIGVNSGILPDIFL